MTVAHLRSQWWSRNGIVPPPVSTFEGPTTQMVHGVANELWQVAVFLAAFSGLYFTVYAVTDETYRRQFFSGLAHELEQAVAVNAVYVSLPRDD